MEWERRVCFFPKQGQSNEASSFSCALSPSSDLIRTPSRLALSLKPPLSLRTERRVRGETRSSLSSCLERRDQF